MNRFKEVDILKGIGIVLMIMGHQYYGDDFDKWIHAFHMPIFFIISGFLYHSQNSIENFLYKKVKTLLIPYLFFAGTHFFLISLKTIISGESVDSLYSYLYHIFWINTEGLPICGAIWFLTALFFVNIFYLLFDRYAKNMILKILCVFFVTIVGICLPAYGYRLPLALDVAFVGVGLFFAGIILRNMYDKFQISNGFKTSLLGGLGIFLCYITININDPVNMRLGIYGNAFLFFFNAILMTIVFYYLICIVSKSNCLFIKELSYIGKNSIVYLGFNQLVLLFLKKIRVDDSIMKMVIKLISLVICLCILHIISHIITTSKAKKLIGK